MNSLGALWMSNYPQYKDRLSFQYLRYVETETEPRIDTNKHEIKEEKISENSCAFVVQKVPAAGTFEQ